jgi:phosphoethanolamine N-methyltransferase
MTDSVRLDDGQYSRSEILKYEAIYGRDFVSPGGKDSAAHFTALLRLRPGSRVLDAGCGLGGSAFLMARDHDAQVVGLDLSRNMLDMARERCIHHGLEARVRFELGDVLDLAQESAFDAVYSRDAFLHVADKARLFAGLRRALVPGGRLLITDYCADASPWSPGFTAYVQQRGYDLHTVEEYAGLLQAAGFQEVIAEDHTREFQDLHEKELARLPAAALSNTDRDTLAASWREKIERIRSGEQRWGLFTAKRRL